MATFYLDPVGGNDANDGTTFANRWQTFTTGASAARIAPGDVVRVIGSPDPTSLGQNATWTNNSYAVTLTSAVTSNITLANSAWTPSTNATSTTSTNRKLGATSSQIAVNATFTTGKAAYLALGSAIDFSAYQQLSFWIQMTVGSMTADGDISLVLCSDTTGDVAVNTIPIPRQRLTSAWSALTLNNGAALGSSIQSIALYINADRGAQTFLLNNILAVKVPSAADSLSLTSLIGKNTGNEPWMSIQSINGTTVTLDVNYSYSLATTDKPLGYSGTTESVTTYIRETIKLPTAIQDAAFTATAATFGTIQDSGTAGSPITFSGGWNRTDMSTQTLDTYISAPNGVGNFAYLNGKSYINFEKLNPVTFRNGFYLSGACANVTINARDINNATSYGIYFLGTAYNTAPNNCTVTVTNAQQNTVGFYATFGTNNNTITLGNVNTNQVGGIQYTAQTETLLNSNGTCFGENIAITNCNNNGDTTSYTQIARGGINLSGIINSKVYASKISGTKGTSLQLSNYQQAASTANCYVRITNGIYIDGAGSGWMGIIFNSANDNTVDLTGATIDSDGPRAIHTRGSSNNVILGGTFTGATAMIYGYDGSYLRMVNPSFPNTATPINTFYPSTIRISNYNLSTADHRNYFAANKGTVLTDATIRHTASGISWKMSSASAPTVWAAATMNNPLVLPVAKIACNASTLVTAKVWVYRTSTDLVTKFVCPGNQIAGVSADVSTTAAGAINTWEELTITFTPTQQGVVELEVQCYGASASVYVDDFSVSQA